MDKIDVKFGEWIEQGFNLYKENFGILVLASLIAVIVGSITVGVLAGPMAAVFFSLCSNCMTEKNLSPRWETF